MTKLWLKDGKLLMEDGALIDCSVCPCPDCGCCESGTTQATMYMRINHTGVGAGACSANCGSWWTANKDWVVEQDSINPCHWSGENRSHPCGGVANVSYTILCQEESSPGAGDGWVKIEVWIFGYNAWESTGYKIISGDGKINCKTAIGTVSMNNGSAACKLEGVTVEISATPFS